MQKRLLHGKAENAGALQSLETRELPCGIIGGMRKLNRRWACLLLFVLGGIGGLVSHYFFERKGEITGVNASKLQTGMTLEEVEDLLGPPRIEGSTPFIANWKALFPGFYTRGGIDLGAGDKNVGWCNDGTTVVIQFREGRALNTYFISEDRYYRVTTWLKSWF